MKIRLQRISPTHHRLSCEWTSGQQDSRELETKSMLFHDLLHFAAESEAGLQTGFWGLLAQEQSLDGFGEGGAPNSDLTAMELVVGVLTGLWKQPERQGQLHELLAYAFGAHGQKPPAYVTPDYEARVFKKLRSLWGEWSSLKFGEEMVLEWEN